MWGNLAVPSCNSGGTSKPMHVGRGIKSKERRRKEKKNERKVERKKKRRKKKTKKERRKKGGREREQERRYQLRCSTGMVEKRGYPHPTGFNTSGGNIMGRGQQQ